MAFLMSTIVGPYGSGWDLDISDTRVRPAERLSWIIRQAYTAAGEG